LSAASASQKTGFPLQRTAIHPAFKVESVRQSPPFSELETDVARLIPQSELHGQRDHILDSYQAMEEFRQAMNRPDDLPGFDDLLKAMGLHRSNYRQGANQRKLIDAVHNGEWAVVKPRKVADSSGASWSAFNLKPEPPPAQIWWRNTPIPCRNPPNRASTSYRNP
jgi:hypothetical protein